jgi:hypothetical protein
MRTHMKRGVDCWCDLSVWTSQRPNPPPRGLADSVFLRFPKLGDAKMFTRQCRGTFGIAVIAMATFVFGCEASLAQTQDIPCPPGFSRIQGSVFCVTIDPNPAAGAAPGVEGSISRSREEGSGSGEAPAPISREVPQTGGQASHPAPAKTKAPDQEPTNDTAFSFCNDAQEYACRHISCNKAPDSKPQVLDICEREKYKACVGKCKNEQ